MQPEIEPTDRQRARQLRAEQVQRRRMALFICLLGLIVLIVILAITCSGDGGTSVTTTEPSETTSTSLTSATYSAELTGAESVPPVETAAAATLTLTYDAQTEELSFVLEITSNLTNPSVAAIYQGSSGTSGSPVYMLFVDPSPDEGSSLGELASGTIIEQDLIGPLQGGTITDLIALIQEGGAYVSIGNTSHPVDAIRGQISP